MRMAKTNIEKFLTERSILIDKIIEKYIPRRYHKDSLAYTLGPPRYEYHVEALNRTIAEPLWEFLDRGGKRWRPSLFLLICEALGRDPEKFVDYAIIPELVHNGLLIIDDIEDNSELRRGKPCSHRLFGQDVAINIGNEMFFLPLLPLIKNQGKLPASKVARIYEIYAQEMVNVGFGQAMDIAWHRGLADADNVSEGQYLQMCTYKTGTLARMAAKIAAVLADADEDLVEKLGRFAEAVGVAFQIQDDILDLTGREFAEKKGGPGKDITEGKRSLMVIHTLAKAELQDRKRLIEILNKHTTEQRVRDQAIGIMEKYGAIEYAKRLAQKMVRESWTEVNRLLPRSGAKEKLRAFADYLIQREI